LAISQSRTPPITAQVGKPEHGRPDKEYTALDLELVNWYATETWRNLQHKAEAAVLWKGPLFELALHHPVFMDAILTTAAVHKLVVQPESPRREAYIDLILEKGLRIIPTMVENLNAPSKDNCIMIMASTILLTIWAFGSTSLPPRANLFRTPEIVAQAPSPLNHTPMSSTPRIDEFLTHVTLAHGTLAVVVAMKDDIFQLGYGEMIMRPPFESLPMPPQNIVFGLEVLEVQARTMADELDAELLEEYTVQIRRLHEMFQATAQRQWYDSVVGFAVRLPKSMVAQLAKRHPLALTMLAYWTAAVKAVDDTWYIHGWPKAVFEEINQVLAADWKSHLRIPAKFFE
jgi:hypothetical protein